MIRDRQIFNIFEISWFSSFASHQNWKLFGHSHGRIVNCCLDFFSLWQESPFHTSNLLGRFNTDHIKLNVIMMFKAMKLAITEVIYSQPCGIFHCFFLENQTRNCCSDDCNFHNNWKHNKDLLPTFNFVITSIIYIDFYAMGTTRLLQINPVFIV